LGAGLDQSNGYYFYSPYNPVFENRPNEIRGVVSLILEKSLFFTPLCETWAKTGPTKTSSTLASPTLVNGATGLPKVTPLSPTRSGDLVIAAIYAISIRAIERAISVSGF